MVENNERVINLMKGGQDEHAIDKSRGGINIEPGGGSAFVPSYKKGMFAPKFKDTRKYK